MCFFLCYLMKSVSLDILSSSSGAQTRKQGDKTKNKDNGKSPVVTITGFRDLNAEFEKYNNNSSNGVNAASSLISTAGQNSINSTNDFSAAGPSNASMPNLEDLSHDADDVGAEADINNLESIISKVWILVDLPYGKRAIGTKWVYRNKNDERGIVIRNKARLVAQGHTQEEDIDYEEALYGLHQAPRAWYETLATYLLENGFQRGTIDQTLFIKKQQKDILLVQIYVDDIIFSATNKALCQSFEKLMKDKFQMSSMGELTFFLEKPLLKDSDGEDVDMHVYSQENL
nr:hypothetical protein [Tanacetum cinerariifolium]